MIPVAEARRRILALVPDMTSEEVSLLEAFGRVLAAPVIAQRAQPPFPSSAMDGYAVRAAEARAGAKLQVTGESAAGARFDGAVGPGQAVRIFTGAPVPEGADTVLIQENAARDGDMLTPTEGVAEGANIRPKGIDFDNFDELLSAPRRLTSEDLALAAAANSPTLSVRRRPRVALMATGDELVPPGDSPGPDQIIASNGYGLAPLLEHAGASTMLAPIARDDPVSLRAALAAAEGADLLVTMGGASVGDHDIVADVLGEAGLTLDFHKIAMRPGKPLMAGKIGDMAMIGLPGNPVSAMVCGRLFLVPAVERMLGLPGGAPVTEAATLTEDLGANGPREHYMRVRVSHSADGLICSPFSSQDSSRLRILASSNALAVRPPNDPPRPAGARIDILRLRDPD